MAAANESQGLKIAVASFVSLSVLLAVTSYFLYSNYSAEAVKSLEAEGKAKESDRKANELVRAFKDLRSKVGGAEYEKLEKSDDINLAIKKSMQGVDDKLNTLDARLKETLESTQGKGERSKELEKAKEIAEQALRSYTSDPQSTYNSRIDRIADLLISQGQLTAALLGDNSDLRTTLEGVDATNNEKVKLADEAAKKARDEQVAEHTTYEAERKSFTDKLASLQAQNGTQAAEIASLKGDIERLTQDHEKRVKELSSQIRDLRNQLQKDTIVLDKKQGVVTYVDNTRKELRTTLNRTMGARELMRFAIFDRDAALPTDRPKATIELSSVNNVDSIAKILSQKDSINPIRVGDQVYSAAFGRKQFALVGKLDVNRDGKDDRAVVKRMIEMAGGIVSYDLPPPSAGGAESGKMTAMTDWIVTDELSPIFSRQREDPRNMTKDDTEFLKRKSDIVGEARTLGIPPMPLSKLAGYLGYTPGMVLPGRTEAFDAGAARNLLMPSGARAAKPPAAAPKPPAEKKDEADTKDEPEKP